MGTARSVQEDWREVNVRGAKLKVSLRLSPRRIIGSLLTLAALYTPRTRKCGRLLSSSKAA